MKCIECSACYKGWFKSQPDAYVCIGVPEPFVISDVNAECTEYPEKKAEHVKHKYLRELFPDGSIPFPYGEKDYPDFDPRDTFSMEYTLAAWLYERLRYFQSDEHVCIDLNYHTFDIDGEELTQLQCIDRMIEDCKIILTSDDFTEFDKMEAAKNDLFMVLSKVYWAMWW